MKETAPSWLPTRKWFVSVVTAVTGLLIMWVTSGSWDQEETVGLITLVSGSIATYLIPNDPANTNSP